MNLYQSILLGIIQGLTEFFPVSSSGHLVLAERLLGVPVENLRFEIVLHLGTLLAVLVAFRGQVGKVLKGLFAGRVRWKRGKFLFPNEETRLSWLLVLATIPAALVGLFFEEAIEKNFLDPLWVGVFLLVTGTVLFGTSFVKRPSGRPNWWRSLVIGIAQAAAVLPGVSRSGLTISAGIYSGVEREKAAEFSFLLSIPLILGAGLVKIKGMVETELPAGEVVLYLAGAAAAALSGYLAIRVVLSLLKKRRFAYFAYYCWLVGLLVIFLVR